MNDNQPRSNYHRYPDHANSMYTLWLSEEAISGFNQQGIKLKNHNIDVSAEIGIADVLQYVYDNRKKITIHPTPIGKPRDQKKAMVRMTKEVYHFIIELSHKHNISYRYGYTQSLNFRVLSAVVEAIGIGAITIE